MKRDLQCTIDAHIAENLEAFETLLQKDRNTIVEEALRAYFLRAEELLHTQGEDENALTNLSYDEFWDGLDIG